MKQSVALQDRKGFCEFGVFFPGCTIGGMVMAAGTCHAREGLVGGTRLGRKIAGNAIGDKPDQCYCGTLCGGRQLYVHSVYKMCHGLFR